MLKDLAFTVRTLIARPAFSIAAIATLAVGIGATTAIFSTVNAVLLRPLPYPEPEGLYALGTALADGRFSTGLVAPSEMYALNESAPSVVKAVIVRRDETALSSGDSSGVRNPAQPTEAEPIIIYAVTEGFFQLFGLPMALGQGFTAEQHSPPAPIRITPGGPPPAMPVLTQAAVLSHRLWQAQFGSDPNIVGKTLQLANGRLTIVGVAAQDFDIPAGTDVWTNLRVPRQSVAHSFNGFLRVKPGTTEQRLRSELTGVMAGVAREFPASATGRIYTVRPLVDAIVGDLGPTLVVVLFGAGLLLLLACVNVTNLLLARATVRAKEIAVRSALGAGRGRIVRQLLTESTVLALAGTLAGLFVAFAGTRLLLYLGASQLPRLQQVPFDQRVLLFTLAVLFFTGIVIGLAPAIRLARTDIRGLLNEGGGRGATGGRGAFRLLGAMIVAEIAVAITLVAGAGWLVKSFANLSSTDPGFVPEGRVVFDVYLPAQRYARGGFISFSNQLTERMRAIGGVTAVGATSVIPLRPERDVAYYVGMPGEVDDPNRQLTARLRTASPGFFKAMGIHIVAGREFGDEDRPVPGTPAVPSAIVNRAFVRRYLASKDPLKEQFYYGFPTVNRGRGYTILGVVDDAKYLSVREDPEPTFYFQQAGLQQSVVVASSLPDPAPLMANIRSAIKEIDPNIPIRPVSMASIVNTSLSRQRLGMTLMLIFAAAALALAAIGIYGVIAYASAQRQGEVATRIALGATPSNVFWMMMNQGRTLSVIGTILGIAIAYAAGRIVTSRLFEVRASDPLVLAAAASIVLGITALAIVVPARRASQTHASQVLRLD
jgi:predicted permease